MISCIIPFFNEKGRLESVVQAVSEVKEISEIICIDDGSVDRGGDFLKEIFPEIKLVCHKENLGKTEAIRTGLNNSSGEIVVLMDGDLKDLRSFELKRAIQSFFQNKLDCLLLCTKPGNWLDQLSWLVFRLPHAATGCRIINRKDLENCLKAEGLSGYQLEFVQNKYLMDNGKMVAYFKISAVGILKFEKIGLWRGLLGEWQMWSQALSFGGLIFNLKQALFFGRKRVI